MGVQPPPSSSGSSEPSARDRLDSWKEIAAHLSRDESTVRRWEKEGLPVHRHVHKKKATVYAYRSEIDVWWHQGRSSTSVGESAVAPRRARPRLAWSLAMAFALIAAASVAFNVAELPEVLLGRFAPGEITSIAVLPLANLSGDPEQEYFTAGMTEALTTALGQIKALRVISRSSVMQYKDAPKPLAQIAEELNVDAVLQGAVLYEGNRVRLTAQLIQTRPERHLWAEQYERDVTSILVLQGDLARAIATEIRARLTMEEQALLTRATAVNPDAFESYLKGIFFMEQATQEGILRGAEHFRQAIAIDSGFAPAYVGLADAYNRAAIRGVRPAREAYATAKAAVARALQLDDRLAEAHTLSGVIKFRFDWDWAGAERDLERAIQLDPSSSRAHLGYSTYLLAVGRLEDAIRVARRNVELDPLTVQRHVDLAWKLSIAGRHEDSIAQLAKALESTPDFANAYAVLGMSYLRRGAHADAVAMCERGVALSLGASGSRYCATVYAQTGRRLQARELLGGMLAQPYISPYQVASVYDALGDTDDALEWLSRAYDARAPEMCFLKSDSFSTELSSDPGFQDLLQRMSFPGE
jgi:TolB-like protein/Tfp pilus assembly protein PilF